MGQTLSEPVVVKDSDSGADENLIYGVSSMQGWRISMEDAHTTILNMDTESQKLKAGKLSFFAVYDGHGGDKVALFSGVNVHKILLQQTAFAGEDFSQALKDTFLSTDKAILQDKKFHEDPSGCTATAALLTKDRIFVANAGDSRTVLGSRGNAKPLSFDHKPSNDEEKARICAAGGFVDFGRVNGNLALSRAIGDFEFKKNTEMSPEEQIVTAYPEVTEHEIDGDDEFIVVACDGIWDCLTSQATIEFVRRGIAAGQELSKVCENLMDNCLAPSCDTGGVGCDNMTVIIVGILQNETKDEWYEKIAKRVEDGDGPVAPPEYAEFRGPGYRHGGPWGEEQSPSNIGMLDDESKPRVDYASQGRVIVLGDGTQILTDNEGGISEKLMDHDAQFEDVNETSEEDGTPEPPFHDSNGEEIPFHDRPSIPQRETATTHIPHVDEPESTNHSKDEQND